MKPGDKVWVSKLRAEGIILFKLKDGSFQISVNAVSVECAVNEVEPLTKKHKKIQATKSKKPLKSRPLPKVPQTLDLHGHTVEEALAALQQRINSALMSEMDRIEIVHGIGTGRVKRAVHEYLSSLSAVENYREDPKNPGVTWVYF